MTPDYGNELPEPQEIGPSKSPACRQCRARKVKCDRRQSGCVRCERLDFSCSYISADTISISDSISDPPHELTQAGTKRRRIARACTSCRATKAKCSGNSPCQKCESNGLECVYPNQKRVSRVEQGPEALVSPASTQDHGGTPFTANSEIETRDFGLEPKGTIRDYIHAYFDTSEFIDCPFLHRATTLNEWNQNTLDPNLLKAICALGARLISSDEFDPTPKAWAEEVQTSVMEQIGNISIPNLQAIMLVIHFQSMLKFTGNIWVLLSVAARIAFTKRLNYERATGDPVRQESLRRLMWSIYRFDRIFSGGIEDLAVCPVHRLHIRLPNSNRNYELGLPSRVQFLHDKGEPDSEMNALAYLMRMLDIRDKILRYTRRVILDGSSPFTSRDQLRLLDQELMAFKNCLPDELKLDASRLMIMCHSEDARTYIVLHTLLYLCRCDLYRFLIPGIRESVSPEAIEKTPQAYIDFCQQRCLESAVWCCEFWAQVYHSQTRRRIESGTLAMALYQCTKIIDHLCFLLPPEGGHSLPQLKEKLSKAIVIAKKSGKRLEWVERCIFDVEKLIPQLGTRPRSDTSLPSDTIRTQEKVHRRSEHVFAPEDDEETDPIVNPLRLNVDEGWTTTTSTPGGAGSEAWPFSIPENNETSRPGPIVVGSSQIVDHGVADYDFHSSHEFNDGDPGFPIDPFDLQLNAYTDSNLTQFFGGMEQ